MSLWQGLQGEKGHLQGCVARQGGGQGLQDNSQGHAGLLEQVGPGRYEVQGGAHGPGGRIAPVPDHKVRGSWRRNGAALAPCLIYSWLIIFRLQTQIQCELAILTQKEDTGANLNSHASYTA